MSVQSVPLVTVLLPLYNESLVFAQKAIDSIRNQTYRNIEILLLLDNPDNEDLKNLIKGYAVQDKRIRIHINEKNKGLPETLNVGIDLSTGKYIARMDGDDISVLTRIERQLNYLLEHPEVDLVGSNAYVINEDGQKIGEYHKLQTDFSQKAMLRTASINMIHPTWLGKSSLFKQCRYRDFMHCEDYDFMARAYAMGAIFQNLKESLLYYRIQQKSCCSISRMHAYEQYINTLEVRKQLNDFLKKKENFYPQLPLLIYDENDKQKYQSTIPLLNKLREYFLQKNLWSCFILGVKILSIDPRPITSRIRVLVVSHILFVLESFRGKIYYHRKIL